MLIGREQECRLITDLMRQRKNILILGEEGVGKSAILENVMGSGVVKNSLYSKRSTTLKETLVNMVGSAVGGKDVQKQNILSLKKICYQLLDESPEYAVLDHIAWVEPKFYGFLIYLKERNLPFVIVTRRRDKKNIGHLWMGLYDFEKIEISNLDQTKAGQLIDYYASSFALEIAAAEDFKRAVFKISAGNPKIILELCWLAQDEKYRKKGYVDVKLMDLDRRIEAAIR
jgi:integrase/recombinase XerD